MTFEEASNVLYGQKVDVDSSVFTASPQPTGKYVRCSPRFMESKRGIGGWADIAGDRMYVVPDPIPLENGGTHQGSGLYAQLSLIRAVPE